MIWIDEIKRLHRECVDRWGNQPPAQFLDESLNSPYEGLLAIVCQQHGINFKLWQVRDTARMRDASDAQVAQGKRAIDKLNQSRHDGIKRIDDWIADELQRQGIVAAGNAPHNSETLGSTIDRLSIFALRIAHLTRHQVRTDLEAEQRQVISRQLAIAQAQHEDLLRAAQELANDLFAGRKRHKTYCPLRSPTDATPARFGAEKHVAA